MPRFGFAPIEHDPFDTSGAFEYARELNGAPGSTPLAQALGKDVNDLFTAIPNALGDIGNALMGDMQLEIGPDGQVSPIDPKLVDATGTLAGLAMEGGMTAPRPRNSLGVFGGINAKTADLNALALAKRYKDAGAPEELIWRETGWAQGPDGEWRFEIPDQTSKFNENILQPWSSNETSKAREFWTKKFAENPNMHVGAVDEMTRKELEELLGSATTLEKVLDHPALYEAYPDLRKLRVERVERNEFGGYYSPEQNYIAMTPKGSQAVSHVRGNEGHGAVLHEVQHAIQTREGFAHGGSPADSTVAMTGEEIKKRVKARMAVLRSRIENSPIVDESAVTEYANWVRLYKQLETADPGELGYQALAGEVEARNVERRFNDDQFKNSLTKKYSQEDIDKSFGPRPTPRETEDTPRAIQWVRRPETWYSKGISVK